MLTMSRADDTDKLIDQDAEARICEALAGLVADMRELLVIDRENAALERSEVEVRQAVITAAVERSKHRRPIRLWQAVARGLLRPDLSFPRFAEIVWRQIILAGAAFIALVLMR
jgi:hypothetical protein